MFDRRSTEATGSDSQPDLPDDLFPQCTLPATAIPMELNHIGVAVKSIADAIEYYVGLFSFRKITETIEVPGERVRVCLIESRNGVRLELVEGVGPDSPVATVLERPGAGPYHVCYSVPDLDHAIRELSGHRCILLKQFELAAHGHRRFAFMLTPDRQMFELCEPDPSAAEGLTAQRRYTFKTLFFEATRICNLSCPMCMASSNDKQLVKKSSGQQLTTDEIEKYVLETVRDIGVQTITWSGGEFLLRKDAVELVRRATKHGYDSTVASNGVRLDRDKLLELKEASGGSIVIAVGINSIEDENAWTRDADNTIARRVLDDCLELGVRRHVVVNVGKHNLETLERTFAWLEKNNIPYNRSPYTARGSGREFWDELHFDKQEMEETIHPALRKRPHGYISYTPFFLSPEVHERSSHGARNVTVPQNPSIGCWCGTWLAVNAEGDVSPCGILLDDLRCGNVRDKSFQEILDESPIFQQVLDRNLLKGKCGRCRYKFTCGGCRAMAYFENGDLMAEDPTCFFEPVDETTVSEHEQETNRMFRRYAFMARMADKKRNGKNGS